MYWRADNDRKNESVFDQTEEKEQTTNDEQSVENESVNQAMSQQNRHKKICRMTIQKIRIQM